MSIETSNKIAAGLKRAPDPVGNIDHFVWDKEGCLNEVKSLSEGSTINFAHLARKYHLKDQNDFSKDKSSQIVKKFLTLNGIDVERFHYHRKRSHPDQVNTRRVLKDITPEGVDLDGSVPCKIDLCPAEKRKRLEEDIDTGKIRLGDPVVPIKFYKVSVKDDKVVHEEFKVEGRKFQLLIFW